MIMKERCIISHAHTLAAWLSQCCLPLVLQAMLRAMQIYKALMPYGPPSDLNDCSPVSNSFMTGKCAITIGWQTQFKANRFGAYRLPTRVQGKTKSAMLPGSTEVGADGMVLIPALDVSGAARGSNACPSSMLSSCNALAAWILLLLLLMMK